MFHVTKHYPHSLGLSAAFRQWRAESHCNLIHGYALAFTYEFEAETVDARNWVMDFGSMKVVKGWLQENFDHRLLVATDDPSLHVFKALHERNLVNLNIVPATGCESFALMAFGQCKKYLEASGVAHHARLVKVTVSEHDGNSAAYAEPAK